jgi:hypothetical protein
MDADRARIAELAESARRLPDAERRAFLDGFRLDAVKHIPQKFWSAFRSGLRTDLPVASDPAFYLVGETFMNRQGIASFVGPAKLDGQFDFPLYDTLLSTFAMESTGFSELEAAVADSERVYGLETAMSPLLGNHDKPRFLAYADGDLPDPREPDETDKRVSCSVAELTRLVSIPTSLLFANPRLPRLIFLLPRLVLAPVRVAIAAAATSLKVTSPGGTLVCTLNR